MQNDHDQLKAHSSGSGMPVPPASTIAGRHIILFFAMIGSAVLSLMLIFLPPNKQFPLLFVVPTLAILVYALVNPYVGIYMYILIEYLRPQSFIPGLASLHIALVFEIITLVSWVFHVALRKERIAVHKWWIVFALLLVVMASTVFTAQNNSRAFNTLQGMQTTFVMLFITYNVSKTPANFRKLVWLLLSIHFYLALKGIYNFAVVGYVSAGMKTSGEAGSGFLGDENDFAMSMNVMIPIAFFFAQGLKSRFARASVLTILFVLVLAVIASGSRGGWVGLVVGWLCCILRTQRKVFGIVVTLLLAGTVYVFAPADYWVQVESITDTQESTAQTRINYWKAAGRMYLAYPITGVGAGNGGVRMPEFITGFRDPATQWGAAFHGTLPQVLAELGTLGMACYLLMLVMSLKILRFLRKARSDDGGELPVAVVYALECSLFAYFASATFLSTAYYPQLWTIYALILILHKVKPVGQLNVAGGMRSDVDSSLENPAR